MNPLLQNLSFQQYFDFFEYEISDHNGTAAIILNQDGKNRLAHDMKALFDSAYNVRLAEPKNFIISAIRKIIDKSSASQELKSRLSHDTWINIDEQITQPEPPEDSSSFYFTTHPGSDRTYVVTRRRAYRLFEIVTDRYRFNTSRWHEVRWPSDFPQDLKDALESANLQADYQAAVARQVNTPEAKYLANLQVEIEVEAHLKKVANDERLPTFYQILARNYFTGKAELRRVQYWSLSGRTDVPQMLCLGHKERDEEEEGDLLIFLGDPSEDKPVVPLPMHNRRRFIESSTTLRTQVLKRLSLSHQQRTHNDKLVYYPDLVGPSGGFLPPLVFLKTKNVFDELYDLKIRRMVTDIDFLVSMDSERLTGDLLTAAVYALEIVVLSVSLPVVPVGATAALLINFAATVGIILLEAAQGINADRPDEARQHFKNALLRFVKLIVGKVSGEVASDLLSNDTLSFLTDSLTDHIFSTLEASAE